MNEFLEDSENERPRWSIIQEIER